ncbi:MAG: NAD(P)/FAD-dependent oxidoreductase [Chloroflexi bacterium]|nr:NAD(P)/FAD-dependent oxidoreductase [Chloroflexota bacterium]
MADVAVIGAGALGMAGARRLAQGGARVTIFEREGQAGGLTAGFKVGGTWLDKFYHHIFRTDTRMIGLFDELGLGDRMQWYRPPTAVLRDGAIRRFDGPLEVLKFSPLSLPARVRLGAAVAALKLIPDPERFEGQTAVQWLKRWMGQEAYEVIWEPQIRGKFGEYAERIAMPWFWARIHDRTPQLGYPRGGFQQIYEALAADIQRRGGTLQLNTAVERIERRGEKLVIETAAGPSEYDAVLCSLPTRLFVQVTQGLPAEYVARFSQSGEHISAHVLILELDRQLQSAYWVSVADPGYPFVALVEHTNWMPASEYGGRHLVYLGNYLPNDHELFSLSDAEVLERFLPHLSRVNPAFDRSWVKAAHVFAAPYAQPIVGVGYREGLPPYRTPVPGVWLANMGHVYPHDRGQNYSAILGEEVAEKILAELPS